MSEFSDPSLQRWIPEKLSTRTEPAPKWGSPAEPQASSIPRARSFLYVAAWPPVITTISPGLGLEYQRTPGRRSHLGHSHEVILGSVNGDWDSDGPVQVPALPFSSHQGVLCSWVPVLHLGSRNSYVYSEWLSQSITQKRPSIVLVSL